TILNKSAVTLGIIYYRRNNLEKAREFFLPVSDNLTACRYLGIIYEKLLCCNEAELYNRKFLAELGKRSYNSILYRGSLSDADCSLKNIDTVIEEYERAIELAPDNRRYYAILTDIYEEMQRLDELSNKFYRKLHENLLYAAIFIHTGNKYCKNKLLQKADMEYEKSLQAGLMTEELALAINELGTKYYEEGNIDKAAEKFNRAIEIYTGCSDAYYNLGNIFLRKSNIEQAINYFIEAVTNEQNNQKKSKFLNTLGVTYMKSGDFKSAFTQFRKATEVNPSCEKHDMVSDDNRAVFDKVTMLKALEGDPNYYMAIKCLRDAYKGNMDMEKYCNIHMIGFLKTKLSDRNFVDTVFIPEELEDLLAEYETNMPLCREDGKYFKKLGRLYLKERKPDKALPAIQKATALNPEFAYLYIELSNEYFEANRLEESRLAADKAIEVGMKTLDLASVCIKIGNKLSLASDWDGANSEYERAWNMGCRNKELAMKINKIGVEFSSLGRLDEAIENFKKSIIILPDNFIFHKNLGTIYQRKGMIKESIKSFEQALSIEGDDIKVMEKLKNACHEGGYLINGIKILEKLLKVRPDDFNYLFSSGRMHQDLGKYNIAIEYYRKAIEKKPDWHSPYAWLAFIYLDQNKYTEGRKNLEIALKLHPRSPKSLLGMARIHFLGGELNLSEEFYSKAIEIYDEETGKKDVSSETYINFGDLYFYKMDIDMAIDKYKKALEIKEEYPSAMLRLGKSLIVKGEIGDAELQLTYLAGNNVEFPELYLYLGDIYRMKGLLKDSVEYYRKVIRLNPDWVYRAYENLGDLYREINEENLSTGCYNRAEELKPGNLSASSVTFSSLDIKTFIQAIEKDLKR
ncbi:MAG: tetratricopeptide repeat protein, partial [Candidatus Eremiobacterota bacterium]